VTCSSKKGSWSSIEGIWESRLERMDAGQIFKSIAKGASTNGVAKSDSAGDNLTHDALLNNKSTRKEVSKEEIDLRKAIGEGGTKTEHPQRGKLPGKGELIIKKRRP